MSVESEASHSLAREARYLHQERVITPAHRKAGEFIKTWSINPIHFTPPYDNAMVKKDIAYAEKMDSKFAALANTPEKQFYAKSATVLEALSLDGIQNGWFENQKKPNTAVRAYHTSLYDDIVNGIDIIVRFEEQGSSDYAGLAIDVTYGNMDIVREKIETEEKKILNGKLSELKYFETENYHGKLKNVPRVIIGIDLGHVVTLAEKWTQSSETIGEDPMQIIVLREIAKQCEHFAHIASEEKRRLQKLEGSDSALIKKLEAVIAIYEKNQKMFLDILRSKPMEMRALVTDKYPDRVSNNITDISTSGL